MLNTLSTVFTTKICYINNSYFNNLTDKYPCFGNVKGCGKLKERYLIVYPEHSICFQTYLLWFFPITSNFSNFFRWMKSLFDKMGLLISSLWHKISPNKIWKRNANVNRVKAFGPPSSEPKYVKLFKIRSSTFKDLFWVSVR